jgi:glutamyl-tRNA synthetase
MTQIVTRFAPSPTGSLHAGNYRTAVFCYFFARRNGGKFILRIEDTDTARNSEESKKNIFESLEWLGLEYDEVFIQSENLERHRTLLRQLIDSGHAYISSEEAKDGSGEIKELVRFKNPGTVIFNDLVLGEITTDTTDLGDFVIARSINEPLFHFAVVVDDHDEGVTHIVRGSDHVANTPRQILIWRALGWNEPNYAHLPLVFGTDKLKLSKRRGALGMSDYRTAGYLPEALLNAMAFVGWNPGGEQEVYSKDELIKTFDFSKVQKSSAVFNPEKVDWYNREYIKALSPEGLFGYVEPYMKSIPGYAPEMLRIIAPMVAERITKFSDLTTLNEQGEFAYYFADPEVDSAKIIWKDSPLSEATAHLEAIKKLLSDYSGDTDAESIKAHLMSYAEEKGRGNVLWPLRMSLSGREKSADPFTIISTIGIARAIERIGKLI